MDVHVIDWIEAYTLDALTMAERAQLEEHLATCAQCRTLAVEAQRVVNAMLHDSAPVSPSPQTKRRLLARVDADLVKRRMNSRPTPVWRLRLVGFALAGLLICAVLGLWGWSQRHEVALPLVKAPAGAQARLVMLPMLPFAQLTVHGLEPSMGGLVYELWVIQNGQPHAVGCFSLAESDRTNPQSFYLRAPEALGNFEHAGITREKGCQQAPNLAELLFLGPLRQ